MSHGAGVISVSLRGRGILSPCGGGGWAQRKRGPGGAARVFERGGIAVVVSRRPAAGRRGLVGEAVGEAAGAGPGELLEDALVGVGAVGGFEDVAVGVEDVVGDLAAVGLVVAVAVGLGVGEVGVAAVA